MRRLANEDIMQYRKVDSLETVLAQVVSTVDRPLLRLMEEVYQPAGDSEKADYWQKGRGTIRYRNPDQITLGTTIKVTALKIIRAYSQTETRMIVIEPISAVPGDLPVRHPRQLALRIARYLGACTDVLDQIRSDHPGMMRTGRRYSDMARLELARTRDGLYFCRVEAIALSGE
jgi:hypothetical protein